MLASIFISEVLMWNSGVDSGNEKINVNEIIVKTDKSENSSDNIKKEIFREINENTNSGECF